MKTTTITITVPAISPARIAVNTRAALRSAARAARQLPIHLAVGAAAASFTALLLDMHTAAGLTALAAAAAVARTR
ncbi:MAG: hypothetical protein K2O78_08150 [Muribaculaceae bacterium]|nr:hypothetical protein [Muribaculaceae bacterium]